MRTTTLLPALLFLFAVLTDLRAQTSSEGKVGYADLAYIIARVPDVQAIDAELESVRKQLVLQIENRSKEVQQQYTELMNQASTLPDSVVERRQQAVQQGVAEVEQMQQEAQQSLANRQKLMMAPIYLLVNRTIGEVAREHGYETIITERVGGMPFIIYPDRRFNISNLVIEKLGGTPSEE